jgi:hypothetical protein
MNSHERTNQPSANPTPTREEVEFAVAYIDGEKKARAVGEGLWPELKSPQQKVYHWLKKAGVQTALKAVEERSRHQIRVWFEENKFGQEDRIKRIATIGKHSQDPLKYIEYADKREGRVTEEKHGVAVNVFTAVATGNGHPDPNRSDAGFCGIRTAVSVCPEQDVWPSAVSSMADAVAPGTGEDTP